MSAVIIDDKVTRSRRGNRIHKLYLECEDDEGKYITTYRHIVSYSFDYPMGNVPYSVGSTIEIVQLWRHITIIN